MTTKFKKSDYVDSKSVLDKLARGTLSFARMLEAIRLGEEMSQASFAKQLGISRSHLCDIEKGRKTVSPARAAKFAKILGYSDKQFIGLALQDLVQKEGLKLKVTVEAA
jgi:transcriptional regulator with XRE-family HTH domain